VFFNELFFFVEFELAASLRCIFEGAGLHVSNTFVIMVVVCVQHIIMKRSPRVCAHAYQGFLSFSYCGVVRNMTLSRHQAA
jgi:hypothetical protein